MVNWRLVLLTVTTCLGGVLFGYDTGFIGAAVTLPGFRNDFGINDDNESQLSGNVVATLQAGCFFGAIFTSFITARFGRKWALVLCGAVFMIGAILQTASHGILGVFYAGRVVSGLGVGAASMLTPTYAGEMAPKKIRGKLLTAYGAAVFGSIALSYWIDYACQQRLSGSTQWLVPVALQLVPGSALIIGMIPLPESCRWLIKKQRLAEGMKSLRYIRTGTDEVEILEEYAEIVDSVEQELAATEGVTLKEVFMKGNRNRMLIAICLMILQQLTGTNAFTYYAPIFFKSVGMSGESASLFATGLYGVVKTISSLIWILFFIERVGRKYSLIGGGSVMACALLIVAIIYAKVHPSSDNQGPTPPGTYAMIVMIFVYCVAYSTSWGPVPMAYSAEIFPNRLREYGVTAAAATQWAFNFMISKVVPIAIKTLDWRLFLMFSIFTFAAVAYTVIFIKETKGLGLEEMDALFGSPAAIDVNDAHKRVQGIATAEQKQADLTHVEEVGGNQDGHLQASTSRTSK